MATLFLIVGLPGAGKTTTARRLADDHRAMRFSPDEWMLPLFGADFDNAEWGARRDVLEGRLITVAVGLLDLGVDVVLDFGFWGREERDALRWLAAQHGADAPVIYQAVDATTQRERIERRSAEAPEANFRMTAEQLTRWRRQFQEPDEPELAGTAPLPDPPGGWATWISTRWPGALT